MKGKDYWYYLINLKLKQWTRSNDHSETDDIYLLYITYSQREDFDTFCSTFKIIDVLILGIVSRCFLAYNLQSMFSKRCERDLQCLTALWPENPIYRFLNRSGDCISVKTRPIVMTISVCLLLGVPKEHTKFSGLAWFFFFLNLLAKLKIGIHVNLIKYSC